MSETTFNESFKAEDNSRLRNHLFPALDESHSQDSLLSESIDDALPPVGNGRGAP